MADILSFPQQQHKSLKNSIDKAYHALMASLFEYGPQVARLESLIPEDIRVNTPDIQTQTVSLRGQGVVYDSDRHIAIIPSDEIDIEAKASALQTYANIEPYESYDHAWSWTGAELLGFIAVNAVSENDDMNLSAFQGQDMLTLWHGHIQSLYMENSLDRQVDIDDGQVEVYDHMLLPIRVASGIMHLCLANSETPLLSRYITEAVSGYFSSNPFPRILTSLEQLAYSTPLHEDDLRVIFSSQN